MQNAKLDLQNANQDLQNATQDLQKANQDLQNANQCLQTATEASLTNDSPRTRTTNQNLDPRCTYVQTRVKKPGWEMKTKTLQVHYRW
jgi:hypothetical protein